MSKREGIIPLTQTEVMLVLATVILLLLVAKDASLNKATGQHRNLGGVATTPPSISTQSTQPDPDEPVDGTLVVGGGAATVDSVLGDPDGSEGGKDGSSHQTSNPAGVPPDDDSATLDSGPAPTSDSAPHPDPTVQTPVTEPGTGADPAAPEPKPSESDKTTSGRLVGFDPCWRRESEFGRLYYYAYDVTFERGSDDGRFLITPHSDLQAC